MAESELIEYLKDIGILDDNWERDYEETDWEWLKQMPETEEEVRGKIYSERFDVHLNKDELHEQFLNPVDIYTSAISFRDYDAFSLSIFLETMDGSEPENGVNFWVKCEMFDLEDKPLAAFEEQKEAIIEDGCYAIGISRDMDKAPDIVHKRMVKMKLSVVRV